MPAVECSHPEVHEDCPGCEYRAALQSQTETFSRRYEQRLERSARNLREELREDWQDLNAQRSANGLTPLSVPDTLREAEPRCRSANEAAWVVGALMALALIVALFAAFGSDGKSPGDGKKPSAPVAGNNDSGDSRT